MSAQDAVVIAGDDVVDFGDCDFIDDNNNEVDCAFFVNASSAQEASVFVVTDTCEETKETLGGYPVAVQMDVELLEQDDASVELTASFYDGAGASLGRVAMQGRLLDDEKVALTYVYQGISGQMHSDMLVLDLSEDLEDQILESTAGDVGAAAGGAIGLTVGAVLTVLTEGAFAPMVPETSAVGALVGRAIGEVVNDVFGLDEDPDEEDNNNNTCGGGGGGTPDGSGGGGNPDGNGT